MALLSQGMTIRDTYEVERFLGEGAFAEVYRVRHRFLGRQALKIFKRAGMTQKETEEMLGEAILLSRIGHPNIVRVFDANIVELTQGIYGYFTMENVPGGSLDHFWRSHGARLVSVETSVDIIRQVCRGLAVAHSETPPIIHRDIKPQNILIGYETDGLRARLSDFGLAKKVNALTLYATSAGTLTFKPPEAFRDVHGDSCAADIWATGVTLYLLLTDHLPYDIDPELGWGNVDAFTEKPISPRDFNIWVDDSLDDIVMTCLEKQPKERYASATELLEALCEWQPRKSAGTTGKMRADALGSKAALGGHSPLDEQEGARLSRDAMQKARNGRLFEAADMMEEAFNKAPTLRAKYADRVRLWRLGVSM